MFVVQPQGRDSVGRSVVEGDYERIALASRPWEVCPVRGQMNWSRSRMEGKLAEHHRKWWLYRGRMNLSVRNVSSIRWLPLTL